MSTLRSNASGRAEDVGDDGVVDDELARGQRVDAVGIAAEVTHRLAHRGQVDDAGTPVKSCMSTRAGVNWISALGSAVGSQALRARIWSAVMLAPSSVRSRFSSRILRLYGRRAAALDGVEPEDLVLTVAEPQRVPAAEAVGPARSAGRGALGAHGWAPLESTLTTR